MNQTMRQINLWFHFVICLITATGCGGGDHCAGDMDYHWSEDGRSYSAIANNDSGQPCLEVQCTYLGKKPEDPVERDITRDWSVENTDFYHYELINLSGQRLELISMSFRLKTGRNGEIYETRGPEAIEEELGGIIIPNNDRLERRNSWVYGKGAENVLHKIYEIRMGDETFMVDVPLVYKR